jgi:hypothetical protein
MRAWFILITLFWVTMNFLLWRAEYGQRTRAGSSVPAAVVWQKMLTAPDSSSLSIYHRGKKIGFCHWLTSIGEELSKLKEENGPLEDMVERVSSYRIQLEGNLVPGKTGETLAPIRFDAHLKLSTNQLWQEFSLRLTLRPTMWEVRSVAAQQTLRLKVQDGDAPFERVFKFSELKNPQGVLADFAGPFGSAIINAFGLSVGAQNANPLTLGLQWQGRHDTMRIGHSSVRTYRLQARLLDRYEVRIFVSRVGEILRVELPDEVVLTNDQLAGL